jgi:hypothetical protein
LISVQTHLLDTWPRIAISSQLPSRELVTVDPITGASESLRPEQSIRPSATPCCVLHRLADSPVSYVEIMPASDFRELSVRKFDCGSLHVEWQLFADFLEKGVIRRGWLQTAFVPRKADVQLTLACCAEMERRPLPLTT